MYKLQTSGGLEYAWKNLVHPPSSAFTFADTVDFAQRCQGGGLAPMGMGLWWWSVPGRGWVKRRGDEVYSVVVG